ncbi:MAG: hypothetical protein Q7T08_04345 [Devosia sp.]|nr:hypothetical protein [Devosia sp.]
MSELNRDSGNVIDLTARIEAMRAKLRAILLPTILDGSTAISANVARLLGVFENLHETGEINPSLLLAIGESVLPVFEAHVQMLASASDAFGDQQRARCM